MKSSHIQEKHVLIYYWRWKRQKAETSLKEAHDAQMDVMKEEANSGTINMGFIMTHAQDHLMTSLLLKDIIGTLIDVYRK